MVVNLLIIYVSNTMGFMKLRYV